MKTISTIFTIAFALSASAAFAGDKKMEHGDMDHGKMMEDCKMHGGEMSPAERQKMMDEKFASIDLNNDGVVSKDEFAKHHEAMHSEHHEHEEKQEAHEDSAHDHG